MVVSCGGIDYFRVQIKSLEDREAANATRHGSEAVSGKRDVDQVVNCVPIKTMLQHYELTELLKEVVRVNVLVQTVKDVLANLVSI